MGKAYMMARTPAGRVTVQHRVGLRHGHGACGQSTHGWSVVFMADRYEPLACRRKGCQQVPVNG